MNRKKLEIILGSMTMLTALFAWFSVKNAIMVPDSSTWAVPMIFFSVYAILLCLDALLFKEVLLLELILIGSLMLSLIFAFSWLQLVVVVIGSYFMFLSSRDIREDMELNIKISLRKSLQVGKAYLIIALSLVITMQYFVVMKSFDGEKKVPHFDVSYITKKIAIPFASKINPQFAALKDESLTVDQFILQAQNSFFTSQGMSIEDEQILDENIPTNIPATQREEIKKQAKDNYSGAQSNLLKKNQELILVSGRKKLSEQVGITLNGNEKISDVFTNIISGKIDDYFNPKISGDKNSSIFLIILAFVLFLTIYPLGSILSVLWFLIVSLIMHIFLRLKVLQIKTITVSKESLE